MKVALFIPCLSEHLYPGAALSTAKVLKHLGVDITYIENQTCCGQPAYNAGYYNAAAKAAEHFITLFKDQEVIVAPSGSCVSMVRLSYPNLPLEQALLAAHKELCTRIYELTEFLVDVLQVEDLKGSFPHRVTLHDSCHAARDLGIRAQPRKLIQGIGDIEFVEMTHSDLCCGFGGTFSYKFKDLSIEMVKRKCAYIAESRAEFCIGTDSSCLMNIEGYLIKNRMNVKTMHIADLLAGSLGL